VARSLTRAGLVTPDGVVRYGPNIGVRDLALADELAGRLVTVLDPTSAAAEAYRTLFDPRGWTADGTIALQRTDTEDADLRITLASPPTVDDECRPMETGGRFSCWNGERAMLNLRRWRHGAGHLDSLQVTVARPGREVHGTPSRATQGAGCHDRVSAVDPGWSEHAFARR
jgi:hypothetical protein